MMFKETLGSLRSASGHSYGQDRAQPKRGFHLGAQAVPPQSSLGAQRSEHSAQVKNVKESPRCTRCRTTFPCPSLHSPGTPVQAQDSI